MSRWWNTHGFTLAELLAAFAVMGLVLAAVVSIQQGVLQAYVTGSNKTEVQQNARIALERMAREIRESIQPVDATSTSSLLKFTHPTDGAVTYTIDGSNNLTRNGVVVIGGVRNLVNSPTIPLFVYYDASDASGATPANTRRVQITLQTRSEDTIVAGGTADARAEFMTSVRLRYF